MARKSDRYATVLWSDTITACEAAGLYGWPTAQRRPRAEHSRADEGGTAAGEDTSGGKRSAAGASQGRVGGHIHGHNRTGNVKAAKPYAWRPVKEEPPCLGP